MVKPQKLRLIISILMLLQGGMAFCLIPPDSSGKQKFSFFKSRTWGYPDRAADFEENIFKDPQVFLNLSFMHSQYDLSSYFTDEWLLQENDLRLLKSPDMLDPLRKFNQNRIAAEVQGSFLFFYLGLGMVFPETYRSVPLGTGQEWYSYDSTSYFAEIRKGSYWKAGMNLHFRKWVLYGGIRGYNGLSQSRVLSLNHNTGKEKILSGAGSSVFNNFIEFGIKFRNFTLSFERTLNIDFSGAECNSIFLGYNLFDLRNYNEKRIPR